MSFPENLNKIVEKIGIGTVQFGLSYGISNDKGQVRREEVAKILELAKEHGIQTIDTARAYGNSEEVLGDFLHGDSYFQITSKFSRRTNGVNEELARSLKNLQRNCIYAYLFHNFSDFEANPVLWEELKNLKEDGKVKKIGFSLYYTKQIEKLWEKNIDFDLVQVPYNIFDRRFEPYFETLKQQKVEIHVRSVFLQGLFFMNPDKLSKHFVSAKHKLQHLQQIAKNYTISSAALPLFFVLRNPNVDKAVIGVTCKKELQENLQVLANFSRFAELHIHWELFKEENENIILPFLWGK